MDLLRRRHGGIERQSRLAEYDGDEHAVGAKFAEIGAAIDQMTKLWMVRVGKRGPDRRL